MLEEGHGQFIAGVGYVAASRRFDADGRASATPTTREVEAAGYLEYGLIPQITLVLAPSVDHSGDAPGVRSATEFENGGLGARLLLYGTRDRAIAVQALAEPFGGGALDLRLMVGQGLTLFGRHAFVSLEPGGRLRRGAGANEARLDVTGGVSVSEDWLVLLQTFCSTAPARGASAHQAYAKMQISAVHDLSRRWSIQLGAFRTIAGRNAVEETGPLLAIWMRY